MGGALDMPTRAHIFLCSSETYLECMERNLFGSDRAWALEVRAGDYCFLNHYDAHAVFGLWRAESDGGKRIDTKAWRGKFPYQVRVRLVSPEVTQIPEAVWAQVIESSSEGKTRNTFEGQDAENALAVFAEVAGMALERMDMERPR